MSKAKLTIPTMPEAVARALLRLAAHTLAGDVLQDIDCELVEIGDKGLLKSIRKHKAAVAAALKGLDHAATLFAVADDPEQATAWLAQDPSRIQHAFRQLIQLMDFYKLVSDWPLDQAGWLRDDHVFSSAAASELRATLYNLMDRHSSFGRRKRSTAVWPYYNLQVMFEAYDYLTPLLDCSAAV